MNKLDRQYIDLLKDILENGHVKKDRTGAGTVSVFGREVRHSMKDGFPLLTSKKMPLKSVFTELIWFLRGETNIKYLVDNNCNIWNGDAYKNYLSKFDETYFGREVFYDIDTYRNNKLIIIDDTKFESEDSLLVIAADSNDNSEIFFSC